MTRPWRRSRIGASGAPTRRMRRGFGMSIFADLDFMGFSEDIGEKWIRGWDEVSTRDITNQDCLYIVITRL